MVPLKVFNGARDTNAMNTGILVTPMTLRQLKRRDHLDVMLIQVVKKYILMGRPRMSGVQKNTTVFILETEEDVKWNGMGQTSF